MAVPFDPYPPFQEYAHPERLVSASWLSARLGTPGLRVIESDEDSLLYDIGHLPGALRIDWNKDLNDPVTRDIIDGEAFARLMREKGISRDDTVVIYDRVRENLRRYKKMPVVDLINMSLSQTLSRTFLTGLTTLFALTALYLWGGEVIADFMFAILIGVLVGTYSSLFIAGPMLILFKLRPDMFGSEEDDKAVARAKTAGART